MVLIFNIKLQHLYGIIHRVNCSCSNGHFFVEDKMNEGLFTIEGSTFPWIDYTSALRVVNNIIKVPARE